MFMSDGYFRIKSSQIQSFRSFRLFRSLLGLSTYDLRVLRLTITMHYLAQYSTNVGCCSVNALQCVSAAAVIIVISYKMRRTLTDHGCAVLMILEHNTSASLRWFSLP